MCESIHGSVVGLMNTADILTLQQAASYLQIHERTLRRLVKQGEVLAYCLSQKPRSHYRFLKTDLLTWLVGETRQGATMQEVEV